ncbi:dehydrogenase [Mycobacterium sp. 852013-50091_SCH5140682]|uniref:SDR family oxidoreductase n=1 Tax=Mycobacterium sp. 852013-50091_SCH5140682 TaxID=1834109 RepID=UPI0007EAB124|nr:SDR family oxidoreductase [Mycobacterium sp. 852013-50091_SCH5140682]OBC17408.1 dehydrogenase [Mycobacterium sp. 852013-50091_SCH5140682]
MQIENKVAVVTGGGSGIGRALAIELAKNGAQVVIGDLDERGATDAARIIGDAARGLRADSSTVDGTTSLIAEAERHFGPVDIFVSNAGIMGAAGLGDSDDWDRVLAINLRAHIIAAGLVLPGWCIRGSGYFVSVASAAGLLTQLGAAGYAVTKHAAIGFAEWLAITHGDDGIGVSCVCPLGVDTPLLAAVRSSAGLSSQIGAQSIIKSGSVITAAEVAVATILAVRAERFMVLPHPEVLDMFRGKAADYDGWIAKMRRLQRSLSDTATDPSDR